MKKIGEFELIDHGIEGSQYFQGCGTAFSKFEHVTTGVGDNPAEAINDLLEMVAQHEGNFDVSDLEKRICEQEGIDKIPEKPSAYQQLLDNNGLAGFDEDEEPDEDDFENQEEYEEALEEHEEKSDDLEQLREAADHYYHVSLRWNEG